MLYKKTRVLVVDDSIVFSEAVKKGISKDFGIEVVGTAKDPFEARDKIIELEPDVMTLDIEMPKMSGLEFLKRLMPQYPLPVVVVSSIVSNIFEALDAGAVDFVTKPDARMNQNLDSFIKELIVKIKIASTAKVDHHKSALSRLRTIDTNLIKNKYEIIAIGASTGGTEAIYEVIRSFPSNMPGVVVTQHMPPVFTRMYAERLNNSCHMEVKEAADGDIVTQGRILIAPGAFQMRINKKGCNYIVECFHGEKVNGHKPSVDVLFNSVAEKVGAKAIGMILTGMGYDGARGLLNMKKKGALTIGQDEESSVVYGMPKVAYDIGAVMKQVALENISSVVYNNVFPRTK